MGEIISSDHIQGSRHDLDDNPSPTVTDANEQNVMDKLHPQWFGRKHGYHGKSYSDAADFCKSVGDMHLCPREAYCPDGPGLSKPLFLQRKAFEGEQWAPVAKTIQTPGQSSLHENEWVMVGTVDHISFSTCMTHDQINRGEEPEWGIDGTRTEIKENILCCQNPNNLLKERNFAKQLDPIWLDESHGWTGGSHDDAMEFCETLGRRKLCPYVAYCPHGPGQSVMGGHTHDFNTAGEQWAPIYGENNHWVMVGRKYDNSATTCMDNLALEGGEPYWGLGKERAEVKVLGGRRCPPRAVLRCP